MALILRGNINVLFWWHLIKRKKCEHLKKYKAQYKDPPHRHFTLEINCTLKSWFSQMWHSTEIKCALGYSNGLIIQMTTNKEYKYWKAHISTLYLVLYIFCLVLLLLTLLLKQRCHDHLCKPKQILLLKPYFYIKSELLSSMNKHVLL